MKKKGKSRKRQLVLVQTGSGGMADALSVLTDDAVRLGFELGSYLVVFCLDLIV